MKTASIVITYDRLKHNRWVVESFRRTAPKGAELIVVDNGSTDGSIEFLKECRADGRIDALMLLGWNHYLGRAWNKALDLVHAEAKWVGKIDNDAYFLPGWHERLEFAAATGAGAVIVAPAFYDWRNIWPALKNRKRHDTEVRGAMIAGGAVLYKPGDFGGCYYIRRDFLDKGLRMIMPKRMTLDTNKRILDGVRHRKSRVVRLTEPGISWEKVRVTDPELADYYTKTFKGRGILHKLRARQERERRRIAAGEITADG